MSGCCSRVKWTIFVLIVSSGFIGKTKAQDKNETLAVISSNEFNHLRDLGQGMNDGDVTLSNKTESNSETWFHNASAFSLPSPLSSSLLSPSPTSTPPTLPSEEFPLASLPLSVSLSTSTSTSPITLPTTSSSLPITLPIISSSSLLTPLSSSMTSQESLSETGLLVSNSSASTSTVDTALTFRPKVLNCLAKLGITQQQININILGKLTQECWEILLCSEGELMNVKSTTNGTVYWLKNVTFECYNQLPIDGDTSVSKHGSIAPKVKYVVLNPTCVRSRELALLQTLEEELPVLPEHCRKLICHTGAGVLHFNNLPVTLFYPYASDKFDYIDECQNSLFDKMNSVNTSTNVGHINIFHTSKYPEASPCTTYIIFAITRSGSHVIIPFRSTWCRSLRRPMWQELMISSYMEFLSGSDLELYQCLIKKRHHHSMNSENSVRFLQDLIGKDIEVPNIPRECISLMCDPNIDILNVHHSSNSQTLLWFSHLKNLTRDIIDVKPRIIECQNALSGGYEENFIENASIFLPGSTGANSIPFIPTYHWSCPAVDDDEETSHLRSQTLASLWLTDENLPEACKILICRATMKKLGDNLVSAFIIHSTEYSSTCQAYSEHVTIFDIGEYVFSFDIASTNSTVVFMVAKSVRTDATIKFLSQLHASGMDEDAKCCSSTYQNVEVNIYHFNGNYYYLCSVNATESVGSVCLHTNSLWNMRHVTNNTFLVNVQESLAHSKFIHWLATLDITLSSSSQHFIMNLEIQEDKFLNHLIFVSNFINRASKPFNSFLSELRENNVQCSGSHFLTLCYKADSDFLETAATDAYIVFLHQCSVISTERDKLALLILTHFLKTGPSHDYLCQENNMVLLVSTLPKIISFSTKGPAEEVDVIMKNLQTNMNNWSWTNLQGNTGTQSLDSSLCTEVQNISEFPKFLEIGVCIAFIKNRSTILFKPKYNIFYHFQTFPLIDSKSESSLWDLIVSSKPVASSFAKYTIEISGLKILITRQGENPAHKYLHHHNTLDSSTHRLSVEHLGKLSMLATLNNNSNCLQDLKNHDFLVYAHSQSLWIGPINESPTQTNCFSSLSEDTVIRLREGATENVTTINKFWPSCSYDMIISWSQNMSDVTDWDYLPRDCKNLEIVLLSIIIVVIIIFAVGNTFALVVIVKSLLYKESTFLIYASLALADLLLGIFPGTLAIYDTIALKDGHLTFQDFNPDFWNTSLRHLELHEAPDFSQIKFERSGFPVFCSIVVNISLGVSLLSLVILGIAQLKVLIRRPLHYHQVVAELLTAWITSIIYGLLMNWRKEGWCFIGVLDPITKLTSNIGSNHASMSLPVFYLLVSSIALAVFSVLVLVFSTSILSHYHSEHPCKVWIVSDSGDLSDQKQATKTYQMLVGVSAIACCPLLIDKLIHLRNVSPTCHFLVYWLSMAGLSWRWSLYTLSSKEFRRHMRQILNWKREDQLSHLKMDLRENENDLETTQLNMEMSSIGSKESINDFSTY